MRMLHGGNGCKCCARVGVLVSAYSVDPAGRLGWIPIFCVLVLLDKQFSGLSSAGCMDEAFVGGGVYAACLQVPEGVRGHLTALLGGIETVAPCGCCVERMLASIVFV